MTGGFVLSHRARRGSTLLEFAISAFMLLTVILAVIEAGRLMMVYNAVANSARAGVRYAIVHGSTRTAGADGPATCTTTGTGCTVVTVIRNFASLGILDPSRLTITVTWPGTCGDGGASSGCRDAGSAAAPANNDPGRQVIVTVVYPYDPLTTFIPWRVRLGSTARGVVVL